MRLQNSSAFASIKLDEAGGPPKRVQVLRVGKFNHPSYGFFEITKQVLAEMKANFDKKVRGIDTAFDYFHESDKVAAAWVKDLVLEEDGNQLWADVDWTPAAQKKLMDRELRYFSPDFTFKWEDPESGIIHQNVLFGGGLTNRPFVKEMAAIVANENNSKGGQMNLDQAMAKIKEVEESNKKLSEDKAKLEEKCLAMPDAEALKKQIADLQAQLAKVEGEKKVALEEKQKSEEAQKLAEKKNEFAKLLSEGKAVAAQEKSFLEGNMSEFIKLQQPVNLNPNGGGGDNSPDQGAQAILKLAEEKRKANPSLSRADSISQAKKEIENKK